MQVYLTPEELWSLIEADAERLRNLAIRMQKGPDGAPFWSEIESVIDRLTGKFIALKDTPPGEAFFFKIGSV